MLRARNNFSRNPSSIAGRIRRRASVSRRATRDRNSPTPIKGEPLSEAPPARRRHVDGRIRLDRKRKCIAITIVSKIDSVENAWTFFFDRPVAGTRRRPKTHDGSHGRAKVYTGFSENNNSVGSSVTVDRANHTRIRSTPINRDTNVGNLRRGRLLFECCCDDH